MRHGRCRSHEKRRAILEQLQELFDDMPQRWVKFDPSMEIPLGDWLEDVTTPGLIAYKLGLDPADVPGWGTALHGEPSARMVA